MISRRLFHILSDFSLGWNFTLLFWCSVWSRQINYYSDNKSIKIPDIKAGCSKEPWQTQDLTTICSVKCLILNILCGNYIYYIYIQILFRNEQIHSHLKRIIASGKIFTTIYFWQINDYQEWMWNMWKVLIMHVKICQFICNRKYRLNHNNKSYVQIN